MSVTRRQFLVTSAIAATAATTGRLSARTPPAAPAFPVHVFSKHLQFLDYEAMAEAAARLGFDGVDLTVRPGGHVEPANVQRDLPRTAAALRAAGLQPVMATTAIQGLDTPFADEVLGALADQGFRHVRLGWHRVAAADSAPDVIARVKPLAAALAPALHRRGLRGAFQNHAGAQFLGSSQWELWQVLDGIDPTALGLQFDIRHAAVERGLGWSNEVRLAAPKIASLAVKDFRWTEDSTTGRGTVTNVPIGVGWVDWSTYVRLLNDLEVTAPISLHFEYELGGANEGHRELSVPAETVYAAMERDLARVRHLFARNG